MSGAGIVVFDYAAWIATYPEFTAISAPVAGMYFITAETMLDNTPCSRISNLTLRATLLNMITAHIAQLFGPTSSQTVGRISSASEGSVSVSLDMGTQPMAAAWWNQTKYGALYWTATAQYRAARFTPAPVPYLGVSRPGYVGGWSR